MMGFIFVLDGFESYTESIKPRLGELIKMKHGKLVTSILVLSLAAVTAAFASMAEARSLEPRRQTQICSDNLEDLAGRHDGR